MRRNVPYVIGGGVASLFIQLVGLIVLSRLLSPTDFGLVAMVMVFVVLGTLLRDFGLPLAGLQARELSDQQASNLFWLNTAVAGLVGSVLVVSSPLVAELYGEPRVAKFIPVFAVSILIGGASAQFQVRLARSGRFSLVVAAELIPQILGLVAAIALAVAGAGPWAIVAQTLTSVSIGFLMRWYFCRWTPSWFRRGYESKKFLRVGGHYGVAQILAFAQSNVDTWVIGWQLGAGPLGYYNRAYQLLTAPAGRILDPLTQLVITHLNRVRDLQNDPDKALLHIQFRVALPIVSVYALSAGAAPALIPLLLGPNWDPVVQIFQVLAVGGSFATLNHISYWAFISNEKSRDLMRYNFVSKPIAVLLIVGGINWGVLGVAVGYAIALGLSWPLNLVWLSRTAKMRSSRYFRNGIIVLLASFSGFIVATFVTSSALFENRYLTMLLAVFLGAGMICCVISLHRATRMLAKRDVLSAVAGVRSLIATFSIR